MYIYVLYLTTYYIYALYKANVCVNLSLNILHYYSKDITCIKHKRCGRLQVVAHILHFRLKKNKNKAYQNRHRNTHGAYRNPNRVYVKHGRYNRNVYSGFIEKEFFKNNSINCRFFYLIKQVKRPIPNASVPLGSRFCAK